MVDVAPVVIKNRAGLSLYGMLHTPKGGKHRDTAILLLSPGIKSRIAPHRLYVKMAERYATEGYVVLRFDYHGLGDSEGDVKESLVADFYRTVQQGRYVEDVLAAMDYMGEEQGIGKFVLGGLCGGALTGLLAGSGDSRVVGLFGLGIPVILDGTQVDPVIHMTEGQAESLRRSYYGKTLDIGAWKRFLSLKSDFRVIWRILKPGAPKSNTKPGEGNGGEVSNFNPLFPLAFRKMVSSSRKLLLIFSDMDRLYWEYDEKFWQTSKEAYKDRMEYIDVRVLKNANHIISFPDSQKEMLKWTCDWLLENYG
jgi:uncharacterized protein